MEWQDKKIHFIGIKGIGMLGLAQLLREEGASVSGSDTEEEFPSDFILKRLGIEVKLFSEANITSRIELVIYSSAYGEEHPERSKAKSLGIPELSYAEALSDFGRNKKNIVVTGTHGKTTTCALLADILRKGGLDPVALVGGVVRRWASTVLKGNSDLFVIEGDEYQEKFSLFRPYALVITSLDYDHSDYYPTKEAYREAFSTYVSRFPELTPTCAKEDAQRIGLERYQSPGDEDQRILVSSTFKLPGEALRKDALLAIRQARELGVKEEKIVTALSEFEGVERRLDLLTPEDAEILVMNDYAHHPDEITATLAALREKYPGRIIIVIFQPHTYSRTKTFLEEFAKALAQADEIFLADIYGSARENKGSIRIEDLLEETKKRNPHVTLFRASEQENFSKRFQDRKNLLLITMGAGDIWQQALRIRELLAGRKKRLN